MRKNINKVTIEGRIYAHSLELKTVQKQGENYGKIFINGNLEVAVDEEGLNVIPIHFSYVTDKTKAGEANRTFAALKTIMDKNQTWSTVGKDNAMLVKCDTSIALNDFYDKNEQLVSIKRNEGGFVTIISKFETGMHNEFKTDMVITSITHVEADEEKKIDADYTSLRGVIFNFRNDIMPIELVVKNEAGMKYFESLGVSGAEPLYTSVWGKINCSTIVTEEREESAFGEAAVRMVTRKTKDYEVTGTAKVPYEWDDEATITAEELKKAMSDREVYLAEVKANTEEYKASKSASGPAGFPATAAQAAPVKKDEFKF